MFRHSEMKKGNLKSTGFLFVERVYFLLSLSQEVGSEMWGVGEFFWGIGPRSSLYTRSCFGLASYCEPTEKSSLNSSQAAHRVLHGSPLDIPSRRASFSNDCTTHLAAQEVYSLTLMNGKLSLCCWQWGEELTIEPGNPDISFTFLSLTK